jgi:hypothetical protein
MRNNGKTSMIYYGGYESSFDVILFPTVRSLAVMMGSGDGGGTQVAARVQL